MRLSAYIQIVGIYPNMPSTTDQTVYVTIFNLWTSAISYFPCMFKMLRRFIHVSKATVKYSVAAFEMDGANTRESKGSVVVFCDSGICVDKRPIPF